MSDAHVSQHWALTTSHFMGEKAEAQRAGMPLLLPTPSALSGARQVTVRTHPSSFEKEGPSGLGSVHRSAGDSAAQPQPRVARSSRENLGFFKNVKFASLKMQIYILKPWLEGRHMWPRELLSLRPLLLPSLRSPSSKTAGSGARTQPLAWILPTHKFTLAQESKEGCDAGLVSRSHTSCPPCPGACLRPSDWVASAFSCQPQLRCPLSCDCNSLHFLSPAVSTPKAEVTG